MSRRLDHLNDPDGDALWAQAMAVTMGPGTMATMGGDCLGPQLQVLWPDPWEPMTPFVPQEICQEDAIRVHKYSMA